MTQSYEQAWAYVEALAGDPNTAVLDWRALHDQNKAIEGHARRGTLSQWWQWLCEMNGIGYGIFCCINEMDGNGRELANVAAIRVQAVDFDNLSALQNYQRSVMWNPPPAFGVQTSPNKFHSYWTVQPYQGNDRSTLIQRKLRQFFDGDKSIIDPTRVLRVPGFYHQKDPSRPHLVKCWSLAGYGQRIDPATLELALSAVNVTDGSGGRHELGDPDLAAPSLAWVQRALDCVDPNSLTRGEWIAITSAIKQAGWTLAQPEQLFAIWSAWCAKYTNGEGNDEGENLKQWNSIRNTELGWKSLLNRIPSLKAMFHLNEGPARQATETPNPDVAIPPPPTQSVPQPGELNGNGEFLTDIEQKQFFNGCMYVMNLGEVLTSDNRFLNQSQFNVKYGGKKFIIDTEGKTTDEAFKAATRSTLYRIPQVDHIRFIPSKEPNAIILDDFGRKGINMFRPIAVKREQGDPSPFLLHIAAMLPDPNDQKIVLDYLAHNAQYPGYKIPWGPVIQSVEGAGKGVMKLVLRHIFGSYAYFPNAHELAKSGAQFNAWMRNKLFILADEIKVDDRRDMIEILKPMISEEIIEIQGKGENQDIEDNFSNWLFFTNWKDAIPINKNARRFAIMYSSLQTASDLIERRMDDYYFNSLYAWLKGEGNYPNGAAIVADYLLSYPIKRGAIPMRAPVTSSTAEAVRLSRGPVERLILEAIEDALPGFRGGWISSARVAWYMKERGLKSMTANLIETIIQNMGYIARGRAPREFMQENNSRPYLFHMDGRADVALYGKMQGWE